MPHHESCPFCSLLEGDGEVVRDGTPNWVVVDNTWGVLSNCEVAGVNEVVISKRHHSSFEEVGLEELREAFEVMQRRAHVWGKQFTTTQMFGQVGVESGGSVSHLHAQVVASNLPRTRCGVVEGCGVCQDVGAADSEDLRLATTPDAVAYLTPTPSVALEIRVASAGHGGEVTKLAEATWQVLTRLKAAGYTWPYNMILHPGDHPHLHLLARVDHGAVYTHDLGVTFVPFDLHQVCQEVRSVSQH